MHVSFASITLAALSLVASLQAQTVHQVGVGGFLTIDAAIQVASPGDVIVVGPGQHAPFHLTKGLTIRGTGQTQVLSFGPQQPTVAIPAGQTAHLARLQMTTMHCSGRLTIDRCTFVGGLPQLTIAQASVVMQRCTVTGTSTSLIATQATTVIQDSEVFAVDCTFRGVTGFVTGTGAITLANSSLFGSNLTIEAGGGPASTAALVADATSEVVLSDSTIAAPTTPCALVASQGRLDRCQLAPPCAPLPTQPVLGTSRPSDPSIGHPLTVAFRSLPGDVVFVWAAFEVEATPLAVLDGPALLPLASAYPAAVLVTDAFGSASASWPIPFSPALQHRTIWLQGIRGAALPLQASVVVGGLL